jgi:hypothetical protein
VIHISPQIENSQASAAEAVPRPESAKKEGLGVFAKILAGLLRKAGPEAAGDSQELDLQTPEFPDGEDFSALFPGGKAARGKNPAKTGMPKAEADAEAAGKARIEEAKRLFAGAAGEIVDPEPGRHEPGGEYLLFSLPWEPRAGEPDAGGAAVPVKLMSPPAGGEENAAGGEHDGLLSLESLDFGSLLGAEWGGEAEAGESRTGRKGKAGDAPFYADSPEENFSTGQDRDNPGLLPGGFKRKGAGENNGEGHPRLAESRSKEKRRDRFTLEVRDFRTENDRTPASGEIQNLRANDARPLAGRGETEILVELRGQNSGRDTARTAESGWESRAGRSFEDFLARELHQNLNGDIVRHASVALRNGGEGSIRLSLRPESLGNVKIRLEMADNKVTGHIVVESEAAFRAFEREVTSLEQAFRDSGFDGADLDMSLAQRGGGSEQGWNGEGADRPLLPEHMAAQQYDAALERLELPGFALEAQGIYTRNGRTSVNMLI